MDRVATNLDILENLEYSVISLNMENCFVTFYISALEILLLSYLLTYLH